MTPSQPPLEVDPNAWEGSTMLHCYMLDYCRKRSFHAAAEAIAKDTGIAPSHKVPIDAPQGLLFEWWSVFWEIFTSRTPSAAGHGSRREDAATYNQHQDMRQAAAEMARALEVKPESRSPNVAGPSSANAQTPTGNSATFQAVPLVSSGAGLARATSSPGKPQSAHHLPASPQDAVSSRSMSRTSSFVFNADPRTPEKPGASGWAQQQQQQSKNGQATTNANGTGAAQDLTARMRAPSTELITNVMKSLGWGDRDAATLSLDERNKLMASVRQVQLAQARAQMQMAQAQMASQQQGRSPGQAQAMGGSQSSSSQGRALQSPFSAPVEFNSPTQGRTPMDIKRPLEDEGKPNWQVAPNLRAQQQQQPVSGLGLQPSPIGPAGAAALYASPDAQRRNFEQHAQLALQLQQQSQNILRGEPRRPQPSGERSPQTPVQPPTPRTPQSAASFSLTEASSQLSQQIHNMQQLPNQGQTSAQISRLQQLQGLISQSQNAAAAEDHHTRGGNLSLGTGPSTSRQQPGSMAPPPPSPHGQGPGAFASAANGPPPSPSQAQSQMVPPPSSPHHPQPGMMQHQQHQFLYQQHPQHHQAPPSPQNIRHQGDVGRPQVPGPSQGPQHAQAGHHGMTQGPGPHPTSSAPSASPGFPQTELFGGNVIQSLPSNSSGSSEPGPSAQGHNMPASGQPGHFAGTPNFELNPSPFADFDFGNGGGQPQHHHHQPQHQHQQHQHLNGNQGFGFGHGNGPGHGPGMGMAPGMHGAPAQFASHHHQGHGPSGFHGAPGQDYVMQHH